jgi:diguanylate cyclase (GGDEF)-like protein
MFDVRTLFLVLIANSLLFAIAMAIATEFRFRDGVGKWTGSLLLQAVMFTLYGLRGTWPDSVSIVVPNALFILCIVLEGAAIREFYGRRTALWWYAVPPALAALLFFPILQNPALRVIASGLLFGTGTLILGLMVHRLAPTRRPARWMLMVGFLVASVALLARAIAALLAPTILQGFLVPSTFQGVSLLVANGVLLVTSMGFLALQKERLEEEAQRLAITDPLTGTFNRRTFLELADKEIARSQRTRSALSVIMLDIDHFKAVNDQYGHPAGDAVITRVVEAVQSCLRREDLLVRYGGEEFCVLLPGVAVDQATLLAERAREAVAKCRISFKGKILTVTISLGVAPLRRSVDESVEQLVGRADEALYTAKKSGRNRVVSLPDNSTIAMLMNARKGEQG